MVSENIQRWLGLLLGSMDRIVHSQNTRCSLATNESVRSYIAPLAGIYGYLTTHTEQGWNV